MKVYILRHAIAEPSRPGLADSKRELTVEGRRELQEVVLGLRRLKVRPDAILSSRYRRAWDTALMAAEALQDSAEVLEFDPLIPGGNPLAIWSGMQKFSAESSVMLVGHEPLLSEFAAFLVGCPALGMKLKKSGFIRIDVEGVRGKQPAGTLRWLLAPEHLAAMQ